MTDAATDSMGATATLIRRLARPHASGGMVIERSVNALPSGSGVARR